MARFSQQHLSHVSFPLQSTFHSLYHTGYKYSLLFVHCYILPLNPRPFSVPHTRHGAGELQWRIAGYLIRQYHKKPVATATAPCIAMATSRHVKVVHSPPLKEEETMTTNSEQWYVQQPKKRRRRMERAGAVWPLMVTSECCKTHPEKTSTFRARGENISKYITAKTREVILKVMNSQGRSLCRPISWECEALHHELWQTAGSLGWTLRRSLPPPAAPRHMLIFDHTEACMTMRSERIRRKAFDHRNKYLCLTDVAPLKPRPWHIHYLSSIALTLGH